MFAKIDFVKSIAFALHYNEKKMQLGQAECLQAFNFTKDLDQLSFQDKIWHFQRLNSLNKRALASTFHTSLNFHPLDNLANYELIKISKKFMQNIGFGMQPFLVYRHYDAGHPHIHIISTKVRGDGTLLFNSQDCFYDMVKANREIEIEYNLIKLVNRGQAGSQHIKQFRAQKLNYGKSEVKMGLENVLSTVIHQYRFTSLDELNAALKLYNVMVDGGRAGSRLYQWRGLLYRILDDRGNPIGVPMKASEISFKPTLNYLEKQFVENQSLQVQYGPRVKAKIDWVLHRPNQTLADLVNALSKEGINAILSRKNQLLIEPIFFVDHQTKSVFRGTDLDPAYSALAIQQRFAIHPVLEPEHGLRLTLSSKQKDLVYSERDAFKNRVKEIERLAPLIGAATEFETPGQAPGALPFPLKMQERKKIRQSQSKDNNS